ncbi:MAG: DUF4350 domain-containing protein [Candidatus Krumholzibacteriia bacterium]
MSYRISRRPATAFTFLILTLLTTTAARADGPGCLVAPTDSLHVVLDSGLQHLVPLDLANQCGQPVAWEAVVVESGGAVPTRVTLVPPPSPDPTGSDFVADVPARDGPIVALLHDLSDMTIMYDLYHDESTPSDVSAMFGDLVARGAEIVTNSQSIDDAALADVDILWLNGLDEIVGLDERAAIGEFVRQGGGLLLTGVSSYNINNCRNLIAEFDVDIPLESRSGNSDVTTAVFPHPTTNGVDELYMYYANARVSSVVAPVELLFDSSNGHHLGVASDIGEGRMVLITGQCFNDYSISRSDNQKFGNQVFDWLDTRITWLKPTPSSGILPPGGGATVNLSFEATNYCTSTNHGDLWIFTDEAGADPIRIPASLEVIGRPNIDLLTPDLGFGVVPVGADVTGIVRIENTGCEPLVVTDVSSDHSDFYVTESDVTIPPSDDHDLVIHFRPSSVGPVSAFLSITSNDPDSGIVTAQLVGQGGPAPILDVAPNSLSADLDSGDIGVQTVSITNTGEAPLEWWASVQPMSSELANLIGVTVLVDQHHGQPTPDYIDSLVGDLTSRGADVVFNTGPMTQSVLSDVDVVWILDGDQPWTVGELDAVTIWVLGGGGLIVSGDSESAIQVYNDLFERTDSGLLMSNGWVYGVTTIHPHSTTAGVDAVDLDSNVGRIESIVGHAAPLLSDSQESAVAAYDAVGRGRIVAIADSFLYDWLIDSGNNRRFGNLVMDWLAGAVGWLDVAPAVGVVPPGATAAVSVTFDAGGLCSEVLQATLTVNGNDPVTPEVLVPIVLSVSGQIDLDLEPGRLDLGEVPLTATAVDTVLVHNTGCGLLIVDNVMCDHASLSASPTSFTLDAGGTMPVEVSCRPETPGPITGNVVFLSNDQDQSPATVPITAEAVHPSDIVVEPGELTIQIPAGSEATGVVTIRNDGGGDLHWSATTGSAGDGSRDADRSFDLTGSTVLYDRSHGQTSESYRSTIVGDLQERGATIEVNLAALNEVDLDSVQVLWIPENSERWSAEEIQAVTAWIRRGGSILLRGYSDEWRTTAYQLLDELNVPIQLTSTSGQDGPTNRIAIHPVTSGVEMIDVRFAYSSMYNIVEPAVALVSDLMGRPTVAASPAGWGRVVLMSSDEITDGEIDHADNRRLANQIFDWLATGGRWLSAYPASGTVAPGGEQEVVVTCDANLLNASSLQADLLVASNDIDQPLIEIPVTMEVLGAPIIEVEPDSVAFGPTFVDGAATVVLELRNTGSDVLIVDGAGSDPDLVQIIPASFEVAAGYSLEVEAVFQPTQLGEAVGVIRLPCNAEDTPVYEIPWTGSGIERPVIVVDPTSIDVVVPAGDRIVRSVTLSNDGDGELRWFARGVAPGEPARRAAGEGSRDFAGVTILFDFSHGQSQYIWNDHSEIVSDLEALGASVRSSEDPPTPALLEDVDVYWLLDTSYSGNWSPDEIAAVTQWMSAGGALFIESDYSASRQSYNYIFDAIGAGLYLSSSGGESGITDEIHIHPATVGVESIYYSAAAAQVEHALPARPLIDSALGIPLAAYSVVGSGRIIACTSDFSVNDSIDFADNRLFITQAIDWLASGVSWLEITPVGGIVPPRTSATLNIAFDASRECGLQRNADLVIESNDPAVSGVRIPTQLDVLGSPSMTWSPEAFVFPSVYVGTGLQDTVTIANIGCELLTVTNITSTSGSLSVSPMGFELAPGGLQHVLLDVQPLAAGPIAAFLMIESDDPGHPVVPISVTGTALLPPAAIIQPDSVHAEVLPESIMVRTVTVQNGGDSDLIWDAFVRAPEPEASGRSALPDGQPLPVSDLHDLAGYRILYDLAHGNSSTYSYSDFLDNLIIRGAVVDENTEPITDDILAGYDVLIVIEGGIDWQAPERLVIAEWVNDGGGLFLQGRSSAAVASYNQLLSTMGAGTVMSATGGSGGFTTNIFPHQTTRDVEEISFPYSGARLTTVAAPSIVLVEDVGGHPRISACQIGSGHAMVIAETFLYDNNLDSADNRLFGNQAMDWLAGTLGWLALEPAAGVVPPGDSMAVSLRFSSVSYCGGTQEAEVVFSTNDPGLPSRNVPVTMDVIGTSEIDVEPSALDFGTLFTGAVITDTLRIVNTGCDDLEISAVTSDHGDVDVDGAQFIVPPNDVRFLVVAFSPSSPGPLTATVSIASNDPDQPEFDVVVTADILDAPVIEAAPDTLDFELVGHGSASAPIDVFNSGGSDLQWSISVKQDQGTTDYFSLVRSSILYDAAHGQSPTIDYWTEFVDSLAAAGAQIDIEYDIISANALAGHDVLWVTDHGYTYQEDEIEAVAAWVRAGGGLLLEGEASGLSSFNQLLARLGAGITYDPGNGSSGITTDIADHLVTTDVDLVYVPNPNAHLEPVNAPAQVVVVDSGGHPVFAIAEVGAGRIVAMSDTFCRDGYVDDARNLRLVRQAFGWLANTVPWMSVDPDHGVLEPGGHAELLAEFSGTDLCGGDHAAQIVVASNDPVSPLATIPVRLHHTGPPAIVASTDQVDWGTVYIGSSVTAFIEIANEGCGLLELSSIQSPHPDVVVTPATATVPVGEQRTLELAYTPTSPHTLESPLTIHCNDPLQPTLEIALVATALQAPEIAVEPDSVFIAMEGAALDTVAVAVVNHGGSVLQWQAWIMLQADEPIVTTLSRPAQASTSADGAAWASPPAPAVGPPVASELADIVGARVLFDQGHGQASADLWSGLIADLESRGATVDLGAESLTAAQLAPYDALWITDHTIALDPAEMIAVGSWVESGKGLLIEGDDAETISSANALLAELGAGVSMSGRWSAAGQTSLIAAHAITANVASIYLNSPQAYLDGVQLPARSLVRDLDARPNVASSQVGDGRIVVMADEHGSDAALALGDNQLFANRVFDWLVDAVDWLRLDPPSGEVDPGSSVEIAALIDVTGACAEQHATVVVASNDPAQPEIEISVVVQPDAAPRIDATPTALSFGTVYIGFSQDRDLVIANTGCAALTISDITGAHPALAVEPAAFTLMSGESTTVTVSYTPLEVESLSTSITIVSDDPSQSALLVPVDGLSLQVPMVSVTPDSISASIPAGGGVDRNLLVANIGGSELVWRAEILSNLPEARQAFVLPPVGPVEAIDDVDSKAVGMRIEEPTIVDLMDLTGVQILFDAGHGQAGAENWSVLIDDASARGATITINQAPVTSALLAPFHVVWITECDNTWSSDELAVVIEWVWRGGNLMLEGDSIPAISIFQQILQHVNGLAAVSVPATPGLTVAIHEHETTDGVESIYLSSPSARLVVTNPFLVDRLVDDSTDVPVAAVATVQAGRVFVVTEDAFNDFSLAYADNRVFANQVVDWMGSTQWISVEPTQGVLAPDESIDITASIRAAGNPNDERRGIIRFITNSPCQDPVMVQVTLFNSGVNVDEVPYALNLHNAPNPFNPATEIQFSLARAGTVHLDIYDIRGVRIRRIEAGHLPPSLCTIRWQGRDDRGASVASGTYVYRLIVDGAQVGPSRKMTLVK